MGEARGTRFRRRVAYAPFASQLRFHCLPDRYRGFSGPVGSGKSAALCQEALKLAYLNRGCLGLIGAPTYRMLADVTRAALLRAVTENGIPHRFKESDNSLHLLEPDSRVIFRSLDQPERLVGTNLAWFGCDELTYSKEDSWRRLEARLREPRARQLAGVAVWTPKGFDWVWRRFISADRVAGYTAVLARPGENIALPPDFYESLRSSYDERFYRQEVLGEYLSVFSGQAYYTFDRAANVQPVEFDPRFGICWALDFNIDPACSVIAQVIDTTTDAEARVGRRSHRIHVLDELILPDTRTVEACVEFRRRIEPFLAQGLHAITVYGDASGNNRHSSALKSDWQIVREFLRRETNLQVTYRVPDANPPVRERVTLVCSDLRSESGERRLLIHPRCKELRTDFEQVGWRQDSAGNVLSDLAKNDPKRTHVSDALGYLVHKERREQGGYRSTLLV